MILPNYTGNRPAGRVCRSRHVEADGKRGRVALAGLRERELRLTAALCVHVIGAVECITLAVAGIGLLRISLPSNI